MFPKCSLNVPQMFPWRQAMSEFVARLRAGAASGDFSQVTEHLRGLGPSAVDAELRSIALAAPDAHNLSPEDCELLGQVGPSSLNPLPNVTYPRRTASCWGRCAPLTSTPSLTSPLRGGLRAAGAGAGLGGLVCDVCVTPPRLGGLVCDVCVTTECVAGRRLRRTGAGLCGGGNDDAAQLRAAAVLPAPLPEGTRGARRGQSPAQGQGGGAAPIPRRHLGAPGRPPAGRALHGVLLLRAAELMTLGGHLGGAWTLGLLQDDARCMVSFRS
eukprot:1185573-Prorocentrum_minimum.AAC.1